MLDGATTQVMIGGAPHTLAKPKLLLKLQSYPAFTHIDQARDGVTVSHLLNHFWTVGRSIMI